MKARRAALFVLLALGALVVAPAAESQHARGTPRIGFLRWGSPGADDVALEAHRQALRELGWIEGQNIAFEYRWAAGRADRLPALAEELVRSKVDLMVTNTWWGGMAAKNATKAIPIVMATAAEAVEIGVVASLARPGGNVTGMSEPYAGIHTKLLGLARETLPEVTRVAFLAPTGPTTARTLDALQVAAPSLRLMIQPLVYQRDAHFESALQGGRA